MKSHKTATKNTTKCFYQDDEFLHDEFKIKQRRKYI